MLTLTAQALVIVALVATGIWVQVSFSFLRERSADWPELFGRLKSLDGKLLRLSHYGILSDGLAAPPENLYHLICGRVGLAAMYENAGNFMEVCYHLGAGFPETLTLRRARRRVFASAAETRILILLAFIIPCRSVRVGESFLTLAVSGYVRLVSQTALAINDHQPGLLLQFQEGLKSGPLGPHAQTRSR